MGLQNPHSCLAKVILLISWAELMPTEECSDSICKLDNFYHLLHLDVLSWPHSITPGYSTPL
ncbi:hypothetical protein T03_9086 [Trichinella britovi]|uniref:Uncharacterized protein n=1 Tax=Trichinella britovi TaxID=45882 RepID=A0A0V1CQX0_TRIBR|nr:hypothetical protein T03_9086 [Trichinella britovi]